MTTEPDIQDTRAPHSGQKPPQDNGDSTPVAKRRDDVIFNCLLIVLFGIMGVGVLAIILYALTYELSLVVQVLGVALLLAMASALGGGFLGILFGIPRTVLPPTDANHINGSNGQNGAIDYKPNNNLEEVSDWLTKIIIGVGLTQLITLPRAMRSLADYFRPALGNSDSSGGFGVVIIFSFVVSGFLVGYFWSLFRLRSALLLLERGLLTDFVKRIFNAQEQSVQRKEAAALELVNNQLNPAGGEEGRIDYQQLVEAVRNVPPATRTQIFNQARDKRREGWFGGKRQVVALTIPVFNALIETSPESDHRLHGELGFALKDQDPPKCAAAAAALTKAIDLRGDWRMKGWTLYEANRAVCRIFSDANFGAGKPTPDHIKIDIMNDLKASYQTHSDWLFQEDDDAPDWSRKVFQDVARWMQLNGVTMDDLKA